jgi:hypothetical protein
MFLELYPEKEKGLPRVGTICLKRGAFLYLPDPAKQGQPGHHPAIIEASARKP